MSKWSADLTTDPARPEQLYAELLEDDQFRAKVCRDDSGTLVLVVYGGEDVRIPVSFLHGFFEAHAADL